MDNVRTCHNCNKAILDSEEVCPNCGAIIGPDPDETIKISDVFKYESDMMISTAPKKKEPVRAAISARKKHKVSSRLTASAPQVKTTADAISRKTKPLRIQQKKDHSAIIIIVVALIAGLVLLAYGIKAFSGRTFTYVPEPEIGEDSTPLDPIKTQYSIWRTISIDISNIELLILTQGKEYDQGKLEEIRNNIASSLSTADKGISILDSHEKYNNWRRAGAGITLIFLSDTYKDSYSRMSFQLGDK